MGQRSKINLTSKTVAIIPAAGTGERMRSGRPKQFLDLCGRPLIAFTLDKFQRCNAIDSIILAVSPDEVDYCEKEIVKTYHISKVKEIIPGGSRRQDSVRLGIEASGGNYGLVLIHDGVRPLIDIALIERVVAAAMQSRAVITALPAKDTIKKIDKNGMVIETCDRGQVWLAQTPQVFRYEDILLAHQRAVQECWDDVTDDARLVEKVGIQVKVIEGSEDNIKVTTPHDLELARYLLSSEKLQEFT